MKLLLVKHSNSNHNPNQRPQDWALTEEGITRCKPLADHIAPYAPRRLFSSTMLKARHTAELATQVLGGLPIIENALLQEHSRKSNAPYGTAEEFRSRIRTMFEQPDGLVFGDETANEAQQRFSNGVNVVLQQANADENVVIIAHGTVNTLFTALHNDIDPFDLWSRLGLPSIIVLDLPTFRLESVIEDAGIPPTA